VEAPLVLVVDDDRRNLKLAQAVLHASGFETLEAASGIEAIELAGRHLPDVILMDVRLPDMDGRDVAHKLSADGRTASIPVVALTAMVLDPSWYRNTSFAGYLEKPIDVDAFAEQVRGYCKPTG
jgi:two-component system, cell cycle response regulator DivK